MNSPLTEGMVQVALAVLVLSGELGDLCSVKSALFVNFFLGMSCHSLKKSLGGNMKCISGR